MHRTTLMTCPASLVNKYAAGLSTFSILVLPFSFLFFVFSFVNRVFGMHTFLLTAYVDDQEISKNF